MVEPHAYHLLHCFTRGCCCG